MHTLVTSLTEKNYVEYGKDMLDTFRKFWPKEVKLHLFYEGDLLRDDEENIQWHFMEEVKDLTEFLSDVSRFPYACGKTPKGYDIQHDARHMRKALTEMHGCNVFGGKVWWIDMDFITHEPVTVEWLDELLPDDKLATYCGREGWMYSETGMIGFNSDHEYYETFARSYFEIIRSGLFFELKGWHDCYAFDAVRHAMDKPEIFNDLAEGFPVGTMHPIVNSRMGECLDHRKGPRKSSRSGGKDLISKRKEAYWSE